MQRMVYSFAIWPVGHQTFADVDEQIRKCKEWGLLTDKSSRMKTFYYKGNGLNEACAIVGYVDDVTAVIAFGDGTLHCIHPSYLKEMQASQFGAKPAAPSDEPVEAANEPTETAGGLNGDAAAQASSNRKDGEAAAGQTDDEAAVKQTAPKSQIAISDIAERDPKTYIKVTDLLYGPFKLMLGYPEEYHDKMMEYQTRIRGYNYSIIQIWEAPIDIATEVFTRINVGGKTLSLFEIMIAKTYDPARNFDLAEKFKEHIDDLRPHDYETLSDATILQTVAVILTKECTRKAILKLDKKEFIDVWDKATEAVESAVEYFKFTYRIPVSHLLPYNGLVIPFAYFFYHHPTKPAGDIQTYLQDFFWRCSISGRYSSGLESKISQDIRRIDQILDGERPKYDWAVNTSEQFIVDNGWFNAGRSFIKAILCLYAYHEPKSFNDNAKVNIINYWLKQANSKNYHHFFPRAYLRKRKEEEFYINHISG